MNVKLVMYSNETAVIISLIKSFGNPTISIYQAMKRPSMI